jgi:hypothetical protein
VGAFLRVAPGPPGNGRRQSPDAAGSAGGPGTLASTHTKLRATARRGRAPCGLAPLRTGASARVLQRGRRHNLQVRDAAQLGAQHTQPARSWALPAGAPKQADLQPLGTVHRKGRDRSQEPSALQCRSGREGTATAQCAEIDPYSACTRCRSRNRQSSASSLPSGALPHE